MLTAHGNGDFDKLRMTYIYNVYPIHTPLLSFQLAMMFGDEKGEKEWREDSC